MQSIVGFGNCSGNKSSCNLVIFVVDPERPPKGAPAESIQNARRKDDPERPQKRCAERSAEYDPNSRSRTPAERCAERCAERSRRKLPKYEK